MNPVKIFENSFCGATLWENPDYVSPAKYRQSLKKNAKYRYENRVEQKVHKEVTKPKTSYALDELNDIFKADVETQAKKFLAKEAASKKQKMSNFEEDDSE